MSSTNSTATTTAAKKMYLKCTQCGYVYPHKWEKDRCNSAKACAQRKSINAAQRKLKITVTKWDMHGHDLQRAARRARLAIAAKIAANAKDAKDKADAKTSAKSAAPKPQPPAQPAKPEGAPAAADAA